MLFYVNQYKINYEVLGAGPPIIFLHGWGRTSEDFYSTAKEMSKEYSCYLIDLIGFGKSTIDLPVGIEEQARFIKDFIIFNDLDNITLISHSYGTRIALVLCNLTNRIKSNIIIDGAGSSKLLLKTKIRMKHYKLLKKRYIKKKETSKLKALEKKYASIDYQNATTPQKEMMKNLRKVDYKKYAKKITVPTLILWGENDNITPLKDGKRLKKWIPHALFIKIPNALHFPHLEYPFILIPLIKEYLRGKL